MISSDHLEPGQTGRIKTTVDTEGRTGHLEKQITIFSNDPQNPVVTLSLGLDLVRP